MLSRGRAEVAAEGSAYARTFGRKSSLRATVRRSVHLNTFDNCEVLVWTEMSGGLCMKPVFVEGLTCY